MDSEGAWSCSWNLLIHVINKAIIDSSPTGYKCQSSIVANNIFTEFSSFSLECFRCQWSIRMYCQKTLKQCVMVQPPSFPFLSLSVPPPISVTFRLHPTSSTCLPLPLLQLRGVLMQLCYICTRTSLGLTSDLLGPDPCAKGYHLYTSYNLSDPFFIINNG